MLLAESDFGTGQVLWSILWFSLFFMWIWLVIAIFSDIIRARDMSGIMKAVWLIALIVLPYLGAFLYLIVNGDQMNRRGQEAAQAQDDAAQAYIRQAAGSGGSTGDELAKLAELHGNGTLNDAEYAAAKAKVLA
jgi:hypothetical protein